MYKFSNLGVTYVRYMCTGNAHADQQVQMGDLNFGLTTSDFCNFANFTLKLGNLCVLLCTFAQLCANHNF